MLTRDIFLVSVQSQPTFLVQPQNQKQHIIAALITYIITAQFANYSKIKNPWLSFTQPCNAVSNGLSWSLVPSKGGIPFSLTWACTASKLSGSLQSSPFLPLEPTVNLCYQVCQMQNCHGISASPVPWCSIAQTRKMCSAAASISSARLCSMLKNSSGSICSVYFFLV